MLSSFNINSSSISIKTLNLLDLFFSELEVKNVNILFEPLDFFSFRENYDLLGSQEVEHDLSYRLTVRLGNLDENRLIEKVKLLSDTESNLKTTTVEWRVSLHNDTELLAGLDKSRLLQVH